MYKIFAFCVILVLIYYIVELCYEVAVEWCHKRKVKWSKIVTLIFIWHSF